MRDLSKFVDRKDQLACFEELLKFEDDIRILAIQDKPGMGKTYFLEKLHSYCRKIEPRVPAVYVDLQQLDDKSPFSLLKYMWKDLSENGVVFTRFDEFCDSLNRNQDVINLSINMSVQDNYFEDIDNLNISSTINELKGVVADLRTQQGSETLLKQVKKGERTGEQAFLGDLRDYCQDRPTVILLDHYERCNDEKLKKWIIEHFLEQYFFNIKNRPKKLLLVITGQKEGLPRFVDNWSDTTCQHVVRGIERLGPWPLDELLKFIELCQASVSRDDLENIHALMDSGRCTPAIISAMVEDRANQTIR